MATITAKTIRITDQFGDYIDIGELGELRFYREGVLVFSWVAGDIEDLITFLQATRRESGAR